MAQFFQGGVEWDGLLAVDEERPCFGLGGGCHHIAEDVASGVDGAVEGWLVDWCLGGVKRLIAEKEMATGATARLWLRKA